MKEVFRLMRFEVFLSPGFLISLALLLLNDQYLKFAYPGWVTGKLSDFAGLFMFSLFWLALFPSRPRLILVVTTALFAVWKSPLAQPAIDLWNLASATRIIRVVDYTDLVALIVLPLSLIYFRSAGHVSYAKAWAMPVMAVALLAMMGTSVPMSWYYADFQLQSLPNGARPDIRMVNERIAAIASAHRLELFDGDAAGFYRHYRGPHVDLSTHYDNAAGALYVQLSSYVPRGAERDLAQQKEVIDAIQSAIVQAFDADFRNVTVTVDSDLSGPKPISAVLRVDAPHAVQLLSPSCRRFKNPDSYQALSVMNEYLRSLPDTVPLSAPEFAPPDSCLSAYNKVFFMGKVTGASRQSRAIEVAITASSGWKTESVTLTVTQRIPDRSVDVDAIMSDLTGRLRQSLSQGSRVEVTKDAGD